MQYSSGSWTGRSWVYNYLQYARYYYCNFVSDESISDELHIWPPPSGDGLTDVGGLLQQVKYTVEPGAFEVDVHAGYFNRTLRAWAYNYVGPLFAYEQSQAYGSVHTKWTDTPLASTSELDALGATAISRCAPTNPHASLSQTLGELRRDGIPAIPSLRAFQKGPRPPNPKRKPKVGSRYLKHQVPTRSPRSAVAGSQYLNIEFGWKPLLSDVRKLAMAQRKSEKILSQYVRDSGRLVRRKYEFPLLVTESVADWGLRSPVPVLDTPLYTKTQGQVTCTTRVETRRWFTGSFTYHVSDADSLIGKVTQGLQKANHLSGVGVSPGVLWDLTPWSWAADWISNTGDVLNNISMMQTDGLVLVNGYIMVEITTIKTINNLGCRLFGYSKDLDLTQTWTKISRQRRRATPFGFGLDVGAFTPRQLAIVAALGLSRDGRKLAL